MTQATGQGLVEQLIPQSADERLGKAFCAAPARYGARRTQVNYSAIDNRSTEMRDACRILTPNGDFYYCLFCTLDPGAKPRPNIEYRMADVCGSGFRNQGSISGQHLVPAGRPGKGSGQKFKSADGRAELSIYSIRNDAGETPETYLRHNLRMQRSALDYTRIARSFFAISSERNGVILYSRCNFSRGRRAIHCFDLLYPQEEKRSWDAIVTRISLSLRPLEG